MVHPRELDKASSAQPRGGRDRLAGGVHRAQDGKDKARASLAASIEAAGKKHPNDLSIAIAEALVALAEAAAPIEPALKRLDLLVEKTPLEPLPRGVKANARQRALAARQVPALAGRPGLLEAQGPDRSTEPRRQAGRASPGGSRPPDRQSDLDGHAPRTGRAGSRTRRPPRAEAAWGRMLTLIVAPPERKLTKPSTKPMPATMPVPPPQPPATSAPRAARRCAVEQGRRSLCERTGIGQSPRLRTDGAVGFARPMTGAPPGRTGSPMRWLLDPCRPPQPPLCKGEEICLRGSFHDAQPHTPTPALRVLADRRPAIVRGPSLVRRVSYQGQTKAEAAPPARPVSPSRLRRPPRRVHAPKRQPPALPRPPCHEPRPPDQPPGPTCRS